MSYRILKKEQFHKTLWSGGSTTQLFIFPEYASLQNRDFDFRISTASVDTEESTFTNFHGYERKILILEGTLQIFHKDQYSRCLLTFEQDCFSGDWDTKGVGKVVDFNVIYDPKLNIELHHWNLSSDEQINLDSGKKSFVYVHMGNLRGNDEIINEHDFIEMNGDSETSFVAINKVSLVHVILKN